MLSGYIAPETARNWMYAGVDMSKLTAGLSAAILGGDIATATQTGGNAAQNNAAPLVIVGAVALEGVTAAELAVLSGLFIAGVVTLNEYKEQIATAAQQSGASFKQWVVETYQSLSEEQKHQLDIPGYDATEIDIALGEIPSGTDLDDSPVVTPDKGEVADSGTVSEDQSGKVDDSGVVTQVETRIEPKVEKQAK